MKKRIKIKLYFKRNLNKSNLLLILIILAVFVVITILFFYFQNIQRSLTEIILINSALHLAVILFSLVFNKNKDIRKNYKVKFKRDFGTYSEQKKKKEKESPNNSFLSAYQKVEKKHLQENKNLTKFETKKNSIFIALSTASVFTTIIIVTSILLAIKL